MYREEMQQWLAGLDVTERFPIWVISYNRAGEAPTLDKLDAWQHTDDVNVVVRASQQLDYQVAYPNLTIHGLPDEDISNVGSARWGAAMLAYSLGHQVITMMDDDIVKFDFLFQRAFFKGKNAGVECSGASSAEDRQAVPDLEERIVTGLSEVSQRVYQAHPGAVMGGLIKRHMSFDYKNHRTQYILNGGVTPRQVMTWHLERFREHGVELDLDHFGPHGDDIGLVATVLQLGLDCFAVPSLAYDHWPEAINIARSVIRDASTAQALHEHEWDALQQYPIRDYLRAKRSVVDGSYEWGDVNWLKLGKLRGQPTERYGWKTDQPPTGPAEALI